MKCCAAASSGWTRKSLQFVLADPGLPFEVLDWRGRAISDEALEQVAQQERRKGFDLGQPPLQRYACCAWARIATS